MKLSTEDSGVLAKSQGSCEQGGCDKRFDFKIYLQ